jgi:hypothetical protein
MVLVLSRPIAWFDLDDGVDVSSNAIDMGRHGREGVQAFGNENPENLGVCGRSLPRLYLRTTSSGLYGTSQKWSITNTIINLVLMPQPTPSTGE